MGWKAVIKIWVDDEREFEGYSENRDTGAKPYERNRIKRYFIWN